MTHSLILIFVDIFLRIKLELVVRQVEKIPWYKCLVHYMMLQKIIMVHYPQDCTELLNQNQVRKSNLWLSKRTNIFIVETSLYFFSLCYKIKFISVKSSSSWRWRKICCLPYIIFFEATFLLILIGTCALSVCLIHFSSIRNL